MTDTVRAGQRQMFEWISDLPAQLRASRTFPGLDAVRAGLEVRPTRVLICGMGGSAMAGSLLADAWPGIEVPVTVWRDYGLPGWAGPETLVVACSHSGNTAETLSAVEEAGRRGCPVVAVTGGGRLLATSHPPHGSGVMPAVVLPTGQPPRTVLGASLGGLLQLMHRLDLLTDPQPDIVAACDHVATGALVRVDGGDPGGDAAARALAKDLADRFTVIYTSGREAHGPGRRLLAQLNENAKAPGHVAAFPELDHNEIVGWNLTQERRGSFALVVLRGGDEDARGACRVDATVDLLRDQFACVHCVEAHGPNRLSRILGLIVFGDLVSAHLAAVTGVDPIPITRIETLKTRLSDC